MSFVLKSYQIYDIHIFFQVGRLPGLRSTVWRRESLCDLLQSSRLVHPIRALIPPCYAIPVHREALISATHALPDSALWVVKAPTPAGGVTVVENWKVIEDLRENRFNKGQVLQVHWGPLLHVLGSPVSVTLHLVITSLQPLRAFMHDHGVVIFRQSKSKGYSKVYYYMFR